MVPTVPLFRISVFRAQSILVTSRFLSSAAIAKGDAKDCRFEYNWIDGAEALEKYRPGGYHPIMIGDTLNNNRYRIVDKLGFGGYSTIWLARDIHLDRYVAVKVGIADSPPNETRVLRALSSSSGQGVRDVISTLLDEFTLEGPNGKHPCYTVPLAQGDLKTANNSGLFSREIARALSAGLAQAVVQLHSRGYVHGDLRLCNVLLKEHSNFDKSTIDQFYEEYGKPQTVAITRRDRSPLPPNIPVEAAIPLPLAIRADKFSISDAQIRLGDFGEAFSPLSDTRYGKDCHIPLGMRPPEVRFEPEKPLSFPADIWNLALAIWEIIGMKAIISNEFTTIDDETAQQIDVFGKENLPSAWWNQWKERNQFFHDDGHANEKRDIWPPLNDAFEEFVQKYRRKSQRVEEFDEDETEALLQLMRQMLMFKPEDRPSAEEVLRSDWMVKWALPCYEKALQSAT